ncbi:electron transport complex subunit E [Vreelandella nanhaiensis]|uniref:Ion-translocating oxidoreductase complex subunit E n=1 Tax=Vreelandella nanhaiensis TaxID=1258546 RepID=A0A433KQA7_9GAMM|nr:electron transport complex subunit E [Halomonas nanhaiensis]RUR31774.1 electron transport complex subunit E [Halomonas nanhaiensis]
MSQWHTLTRQGLWSNNPALVQLLGLCPLLAVSTTVVNSLGLAIATLFVMVGSSTAVSLVRHQVSSAVRLPAFVMIIAAFVTCAELLMAAYAYPLYQLLGIFIPLIVTNCAILGRADAFASRQPVGLAALDGLMMGIGFGSVLVVLGGIRELLGQGTLFSDMALLFGPIAANWQLTLVENYQFLFFVLPPGAFFVAGMLIALKNVMDQRSATRTLPAAAAPRTDRRVRVTGIIK